ncbi:hypothetical protein [Alkalihalobacillus sp. AL-G]|uniref:hypothetical protein n=1 Tax=Alkalihalobacillus sp. AL-G TaxID=2926399 RepID=UPI00272CB214|nr:hypothetical protein [Alkalihalobacillus sp. AL-G]WLD94841.1 hypothetical protein MOJ78_08160 [Alkalihalobacillus sp. AL-G]
MEHHVQIWKGLLRPKETVHTLRESTNIQGYRLRLLILLLCSSIVFGLLFYVNSEEWLNMPDARAMNLSDGQQLAASILIGVGGAIAGLVIPFVLIGAGALSSWGFFRDLGFKKLFVLNTYLFVIILFGLAANIPFMLKFGSTEILSPFGFGPWVKLLTDNVFLFTLAGWVTLFFIWHLIASTRLLHEASLKSSRYVYTVSIGLHVGFILVVSLINSMYHMHLNG